MSNCIPCPHVKNPRRRICISATCGFPSLLRLMPALLASCRRTRSMQANASKPASESNRACIVHCACVIVSNRRKDMKSQREEKQRTTTSKKGPCFRSRMSQPYVLFIFLPSRFRRYMHACMSMCVGMCVCVSWPEEIHQAWGVQFRPQAWVSELTDDDDDKTP